MAAETVNAAGFISQLPGGYSHEVIERGAAILGWDLDTLIGQTLEAMQASAAVE